MQNIYTKEKHKGLTVISQIYCCFIFLVFPLMLDSTRYGKMTVFKFKTFRTSALIYFAVCLVLIGYYFFYRNAH